MNHPYPQGTCVYMCPENEMYFREKAGLLNILEIVPGTQNYKIPKVDRNRVVKEFSRSAAGRQSQNVKDLRTIDALIQTTNYLLHDVVTNEYYKWNVIYDFIMNRFQAIRQDMVIQSFPKPHCICILQPIVRFYAYSAYRLCEEPVAIYDPVIHKIHLQECLKRLLTFYDDTDILISKFNNSTKEEAGIENGLLYVKNRSFMEALYLIVNLGSNIAMERTMQIPKMWRTPLVKKCFTMSLEYWRGNYVKVCKMIRDLPCLLQAYAVLQLPLLRKKALEIMSLAYNGKNLIFPCNVLQKLFLFNNVEEVVKECTYYNIPIDNEEVIFTKLSFNATKSVMLPKYSDFVDCSLAKHSIADLLLEDEPNL